MFFLVYCAQNNTFLRSVSKCPGCRSEYIGFTPGPLADQSWSVGACTAMILAELSGKSPAKKFSLNIHIFFWKYFSKTGNSKIQNVHSRGITRIHSTFTITVIS